MGLVFRALDRDCERTLAIKVLRPEYRLDRQCQARFLFEARLTARLQHPGIVPIYGMGVGPDGRPHYAMRFIAGETLEETVRRFHAAAVKKQIPAERTLALRQLLTHSEKVVRDLLEHLNTVLMPREQDFRDLSRPIRRRSHYPTLLALHKALQTLHEGGDETQQMADYLLELLEEIREHARRERITRR